MKTIKKKAISTILAAALVLAICATGVPAKADYLAFDGTYHMKMLFNEGYSNQYGDIRDYDGKLVMEMETARGLGIEFSHFSNGLIMAKVLVDSTYTSKYKYGYLNRNFEVVTPLWFDDARPYSEGLAAVYDGELKMWGYIDVTGNVVLPFRYTHAYSFSEGLAMVHDKYTNISGFINKSGEMVIPDISTGWNEGKFSDGLCFVRKMTEPGNYYADTVFGILDKNGNFVQSSLGLRDHRQFSEGLAPAQEDASGKWGFINAAAQWVIAPQYLAAHRFSEGLAAVSSSVGQDGTLKFGFIDKSGTLVIPEDEFRQHTYIETVIEFHEGLCAIYNRYDRLGYIDKTGKTVISFQYNMALDFKEGHALVGAGSDMRVIKNPLGVTAPALPPVVQPPPVPLYPPAVIARPTASPVVVNGVNVAFDAYMIKDNNYFKLRDIAFILNGSSRQFEVVFDEATNSILVTRDKPYTANGTEMQGKGSGEKTPVVTTQRVLVDGREVQITAYNIDGNNYFKLRDIGYTIDFKVEWVEATNTIIVDTSRGYSW